MLTRDADSRISASVALKQPWFNKFTQGAVVSDVDLRLSLCNLRTFRTQLLFQGAVLTYIASQRLSRQEEAKIRLAFDTFDSDKDGELSKKELIAGLRYLYGCSKKAKKEAAEVLKNIDLNHNGTIEYNGRKCMDMNRVLGGQPPDPVSTQRGELAPGL